METEVKIDGKTRTCGLIGNPVEHTLSPVIHNTLAGACNINMAYLPFFVEKEGLEAAVKGAYSLNMLGMNVTVPFKRAVIPYLHEVEPLAAAMESVNTLVRTKEGFKGYNTDMSGLFRAMGEDNVRLEGEDVIVIGAGGAGRAVAYLCAAKGAGSVTLLNRSKEKAEMVAEEVNRKTGRDCVCALGLDEAYRLSGSGYLAIQATSVGLFPDSERAAIEDFKFYRKIHTGYDLIYRPAQTRFMTLVGQAGGRAFNGLKMLVYQGIEAFELWNGVRVPKGEASQIYKLLSCFTGNSL